MALIAAALMLACGSSTPTADEPHAPRPERDSPAAPEEEATERQPRSVAAAFDRCEAPTRAVEGLDPSPSVHALSPATPLSAASAPSVQGEPIGGDVAGFVWWTSERGRRAVLMRFEGGPPSFGHHGEVVNADATAWLVDPTDGTHEPIAEMIAAAPTAVAVRMPDGRILLVRGDGERVDLTALGVDARSDSNRCLNRRQVSFDPTGRYAGWLARDPARLVVRALDGGAQCQIEADAGELWRAYPGAIRGWAVLREIAADTDGDGALSFPVQQTSCACRWCNRFALSYGFYGWGGDAFASFLVAPDGTRLPVEGAAYAVGDAAAARVDPEDRTLGLTDAAGQPVTLPAGCELAAVAPGAPSVLLRCDSAARLFFPDDGRTLELPARVEAGGVLDARVTDAGHVWAPVRASTDERTTDAQTWRAARLRMNDGRLELGPEAGDLATVDAGWAIFARDGELTALHLGDGHAATVALPDVRRVLGLAVRLEGDRTALLSPRAGRYLVVDAPADGADERGCAVVPSGTGERGIARGPWRRTCP